MHKTCIHRPRRLSQTLSLLWSALVLASVVLGGTFGIAACGGPEHYTRPTRWLPAASTQTAKLSLGQAAPGSTAPLPDAQAALQAWIQGDLNAAVAFFDTDAATQTAQGLMGRAQLALQRGLYTHSAQTLAQLLIQYPDDPLASTAAMQLWELRTYPGQFEQIAANAIGRFEWSKASPIARLYMQRLGAMLEGYKARINGEKTPDLTPWGRPNQWNWIGPLSYFEIADFNTPFTPETEPALAERYETHDLKLKRASTTATEQIEPNFDDPGIYYFESFVEAAADTDAVLVLRSGSGVKLWVDGQLALERAIASGYPALEQAREIKLSKGRHRLLVKLGSGGGGSSFEVALLPKAPGGLTSTTSGDTSPSTLGQPVPLIPDTQGKDTDKNPWTLWQIASLAKAAGDFERAQAAVEALEAVAPNFSALHIIAAEISRSDSTLDPVSGLEQALSRYRALLNLDPDAGHAHMLLGFLLYNEERYEEALASFDALIAKVPDEFLPHYYRYRLLEALDISELAEGALRTAVSLRPSSCNLARDLIDIDAQTQYFPDPSELPPESLYCPDVQHALARLHHIPRAEHEQAISILSRLAQQNPQQSDYWLDLSRAHVAQANHQAALDTLTQAASFQDRPETAFLTERTDLLITLGRLPDARALISTALAIAPADLEIHTLARVLGQAPALNDMRIDGLKLVQDYLKAERNYANLAGFYLLDYAAFRYFPDGSNIAVTHQISQVLTKEGIELLGEVRLPDDAVITRLRTIKADGSTTVEPESIPNKNGISMPNLEVGDFVEVEYLSSSQASPQSQGHFSIPRWYFQITDAPLIHSEVIIEVPKSIEPLIDVRGNAASPTITEHGDFKRYRYLMTEMLPPRAEPLSPPGLDLVPSIEMNHGARLEDIQRHYFNSLSRLTRPSPSMSSLLNEARANAPQQTPPDSPAAKAALVRALYDLIRDRVHPNNEGIFASQAAWIWSRRSGNNLTLLKTLLDMAQIPAQVVLIKPFGASEHTSPIPSLDDFNQVLLRVDVGESRPLWIDFSNEFSPFNTIPLTFQNRPAVAIDAASTPLTVDASDPELERQHVTFDLSISPDGHLSGKGSEVSAGFRGAGLRGFIKQIKDDPTKINRVLESFLGTFFRDVSIKTYTFDNADTSDGPVTVAYTFEARNFGTVTPDNTLEVKAFIYNEELSRDLTKLSERKHPLILTSAHYTDSTFNLSLPPGAKLLTPPPDQTIDTPFGRFERRVTLLPDGRISLHERLDVPLQTVAPDQYAAFTDFCTRVDLSQVIQLRASLPPPKKAKPPAKPTPK